MFEKIRRDSVVKGIALMDSLLQKNPNLVHCMMAKTILSDIASCDQSSEYFCMRAIHELSLVIAGFTNNRDAMLKEALEVCKVLTEISATAE